MERHELAQHLAETFAPTLVIYPEDRAKRPYDERRILEVEEMGDYQPCPVDLALDNFRLYRQGLVFRAIGEKFQGRPARFSTELQWLQDMILNETDLDDSEINLTGVEHDRPSTAWDQYFFLTPDREGGMARLPEPHPVVVYARVISAQDVQPPAASLADGTYTPEDVAIQYWSFYYYNHFWNLHEIDWELVTVIVRPDGQGNWQPIRTGYSAHVSGTRREWQDVLTNPDNPNSPLVFVSAGSHAQYFDHDEKGYAIVAREIRRFAWLRRFLAWIVRINISDMLSRRMVDVVPPNEKRFHLRPKVVLMPKSAPVDDPQWWWMNYKGRWGAKPRRMIDLGNPDRTLLTEGPRGPWLQGNRWSDPFAWVQGLHVDDPTH